MGFPCVAEWMRAKTLMILNRTNRINTYSYDFNFQFTNADPMIFVYTDMPMHGIKCISVSLSDIYTHLSVYVYGRYAYLYRQICIYFSA